VDNDCDGVVDESDAVGAQDWYLDEDGDGHGLSTQTTRSCEAPSGWVAVAGDCDDTAADVHPGAEERCGGGDENCDGEVDEGTAVDALLWYADTDGDGYGDAAAATTACVAPSGHLADDTDCDDADAWTSPGATELCDGVQNDCSDTSWTDDAGLASFWTDSTASWADVTGTVGAGTLSSPAAVGLATDGVLQLCAGTWPVLFTVSASVELFGVDGAADVVLSGADTGTILSVTTDGLTVGLTDLTLRDGLATQTLSTTTSTATGGGAVFCDATSDLELDGAVFTENTADSGGALAAVGCNTTADSVTWSNNTAAIVASAAHTNGGDWTETDGLYEDNEAPRGGLQLYNTTASLTDVVIDGNIATEGGSAALYLGVGSTLTATRLTVQNCETGLDTSGGEHYGGPLWLYTGSTVTIDQSTFLNNSADNIAGAIYVVGADLTITDTTFSGNSSVSRGGALFVRDASTVRLDADTVFSGNSADTSGGALHVSDDCTIEAVGTEFSTNSAGTDGGAIYLDNAALTATSSPLFTSNSATQDGGAIAVVGPDGSVSLTDTTLSANTAGGDGGGLAMVSDSGSPTATLTRGSITTNTASGDGGGVSVSGSLSASAVSFGGTNSPSDTTAGTDDDTWGTSASFSCTSTGCN
jgi:predicted outer membrane repeat protein